MALRHRDIVSAVTDRENLHSKQVKPQIKKQLTLVSRPALGEVSNKVNGVKHVAKRQEPVKDLKKKTVTKENVPTKKEPGPALVSYSSRQLDVIDPDADSKDEPQMVTEYLADIYSYLRELETKLSVRENFLEGHESSPKMRAILVNWLVQVHSNFKLCLETLYLCVSITDRYLQENKHIGRETLQLVGTSAMMVACKYEEMFLPELSDFVYICDDTFSKKQILKMEIDILNKLDCSLGRPLPIHFLRRYSKIAQVRMEQHTLGKYVLELALLDHSSAHIKPSIQAAAACYLSICILNDVSCPSKIWTPTLVHYTTYSYSDFKHVVAKFANMLLVAGTLKNQAIQSKYATSNFAKISTNPKLKGPLVERLAHSSPKS
ncbi:Cyclin N domain containing protein [Asbolus verrucosus]|uniref:Cyclin N domain containing protein n=1 Tax=Asbolus verrucosus TaxID=1661398 RepID=A0A482VPK0_ASBVE|nr:Cyclin N domain containing protein [Asbolus verrucosus]